MTKHTAISVPDEIVVGKDILELVSSAMYVDPLTIYREYIQNAADSIDEGKRKGLIAAEENGRVDITLDLAERRVKIRDNGAGVPNNQFARRLTALGGSQKRGTSARGFRGIGRLAGLGYCQELIFRSRAAGDRNVHELRWDCRTFKKLLQDHTYEGTVRDLIQEVATIIKFSGDGWPEHFYEVELIKPLRIKNDLLLNRDEISLYLSQTAGVPFSPEFKFGRQIQSTLQEYFDLGELDIHIDGAAEPIYRPYRDTYAYAEDKRDAFTDLEFNVLEGVNGKIAAVGWRLHHGYHGAILPSEGIGGLRARKGNIQVGTPRIFAEIFPEARFASWTVGEIHVIDDRIVPNGRRDEFEYTPPYSHLLNQLAPIGDQIAKLCRSSSVARNRIKTFDTGATKIHDHLEILEQGVIEQNVVETLIEDVRSELHEIKRVTEAQVLDESNRAKLEKRYSTLEERFQRIQTTDSSGSHLIANLPENERATIQKMIALIYECSINRVVAKVLVDRILARLGANNVGQPSK